MIFWSCFRGVRTLKIEFSPRREPNFHFFAKFDFSSILGSILESFWDPSSQLYSFLEVQRVSKKVFEKGMKKRCERKELSEQCFLGGPLRDQILSDFLVLFQGGPDTEN